MTLTSRPENYDALLLKWSADQDLSASTLNSYRHSIRALWKWSASQEQPIGPDEISGRDLRQWRVWMRREKHHSPSAVNRAMCAVKSFYRWLYANEHIDENPTQSLRHIRSHKRRGPRRDELTDSDVRKLLSTCDASHASADIQARDRAILALMLYAGLQPIEIRRLRYDHLRERSGRFVIEVHGRGKQAADDFMVLNEAAENALREWLDHHPRQGGYIFISLGARATGRPMDDSTIRRMIMGRCRAARIAQKSAGSLRRTFIGKLIDAGLPPQQVQALSRHTDYNTTRRYYRGRDRLAAPGEDLISYDPPSE